MNPITSYNDIIPLHVRKRLNMQKNRRKLVATFDEDGKILQPFIYVIGLGERHFKSFDEEIVRLIEQYPWTKKKHFRFIMNELIINSQFSMLREVVKRVPQGKKTAGYFFIKIYLCESFVSVNIEEFGDFFDYLGFLEDFVMPHQEHNSSQYYDYSEESHTNKLDEVTSSKIKLILTRDSQILVPDDSNKIGLNVIENATDNDFYVTSFYKDGKYMWKRVYFRIENQQ